MAGRTPHEAVQNFVPPLQKALSCVCTAVLSAQGGYQPRDEPYALTLNRGQSVPLSGGSHLYLRVAHHYRIAEASDPEQGPWKVQTAGYYYALDDEGGREVIAYHWHPHAQGAILFAHIHLGAGAEMGRRDLAAAHLPSGPVALEEVLRLAIRDLGVEPRRDDWQAVLYETQQAYEAWRTWP